MSSTRSGIFEGWRMPMFGKRHAERGKLLFRAAADKQPQPVIRLVIVIAVTIVYAVLLKEHLIRWTLLLFYIPTLVPFLFSGNVAFFESGIYFSSDRSGGGRFISWPEIERFHWDGDVLIIVPRAVVFLSASGTRGAVLGGRIKIPPARRTQVENLLASELRPGSEPGM